MNNHVRVQEVASSFVTNKMLCYSYVGSSLLTDDLYIRNIGYGKPYHFESSLE